MSIPIKKVFRRILIILLLSILISTALIDLALAADSDGDGLDDDWENIAGSFWYDADTDDDGVLDGDEVFWDQDSDGDGIKNVLDYDSDNDGIRDGTEAGVTVETLHSDTDVEAIGEDLKPTFIPDSNTTQNKTNMTLVDTDGDGWEDKEEDKNGDGYWDREAGETDPTFADHDFDGIRDDIDTDDDNDGMSDVFEKEYPDACDFQNETDRDLDIDQDGFTNYQEYLGHYWDNKAGSKGSTDPTNITLFPNTPPQIMFSNERFLDKVKNKKIATAKILEDVVLDIHLMEKADEAEPKGGVEAVRLFDRDKDYEKKGLNISIDWGDGGLEEVYRGLSEQDIKDFSKKHRYLNSGNFTITIKAHDHNRNFGVDELLLIIAKPPGVTGLIYNVPRQPEYNHNGTIRTYGWVAYRIKDVKKDEKITIEFSVQAPAPNQNLRVYIIPYSEEQLQIFIDNDKVGKKGITERKYSSKWIEDGAIRDTIVIEADEEKDILVIFDNGYYWEGQETVTTNEPLTYKIKITREESQIFIILMVLVLIIIIAVSIIGAFFYMKLRETKGVQKVTREAAIETQRSLDREMAQLELEIQESLQRGPAMGAGGIAAMPLQQQPQQQPGPVMAGAGQPSMAPGTVPQTPMPVGVGGVGAQAPGMQPGQPAMQPSAPGTTPGQQPMLPAGGSGVPTQQKTQVPGTQPPGQAPQPQMLPPAQPGTTPQPQQTPQKPPQQPTQQPSQQPKPQQQTQ